VRRLRVAYVAHSVDQHRGGMELVSARLLERLAEAVDLEVVAGDGLETLPAGVRRTRIAIPSHPNVARLVVFDLLASVRLARVRRRVDLVHSCGAVAHARVDLVTMHLSHAAVIEAQGGATPPGRRGLRGLVGAVRRRWAASIERWLLRPGRVRRVAAVSRSDAVALAARYPTLDVVVIENGADLEAFDAGPVLARDAAAPLGVVVVAGDFERKGVALAVEAIALTRRARLVVVGAGDLAAMRSLAASLGVADRVELTGHLDDVAPRLCAADVVLSCSLHESFGLALVEGATAGCAVVCTETGVGPELVGEDGSARGGVVVPREAAAIARVLDELDEQRADCVAMGEVARDRARRFTWDEMVRETLRSYAQLAGAP
jgi:glycosyltransferase involved in cell wall biosynthesis